MIEDTEVEGAAPTARLRARRVDAQAARERRRRHVTWALSITLGVLLIDALVGNSGYLAMLRTEREERQLRAQVAGVIAENHTLQQEGRRLRTDPDAVEEAARRQLNFIKPGETLVIVRKPEADRVTPSDPPTSSR